MGGTWQETAGLREQLGRGPANGYELIGLRGQLGEAQIGVPGMLHPPPILAMLHTSLDRLRARMEPRKHAVTMNTEKAMGTLKPLEGGKDMQRHEGKHKQH